MYIYFLYQLLSKMAVKRFRKYGKKRRGLRRRTTRRTNRLYRTMLPRNVHYFTRYAFSGNVSVPLNANGQLFGACYTEGISRIVNTLANISMPSSSEFTNLFDQYKVLSYTFEFIPRFNSQDALASNGVSSGYLPTIYWYFDTDDGSSPSDMTEVMQHQHVRKAVMSRPISITVKYPCVSTEIYRSAITTGYGVKRSPWLDQLVTDVPHFGFKYAIQGANSFTYTIDCRVRWRIAVRNPR